MKKIACLALLAFVFLLISGCVIARPRMAPPPPKKDIRPAKPGPEFLWIEGNWIWSSGQYTWSKGFWVKKKPGKNWVPGRWEKRGRHWVWIKGRWR